MRATGDVPDIDMSPRAKVGVAEAHDQEGGEEEEPAIDECIDLVGDDDDFSPQSLLKLNQTIDSIGQAPRPDNTFGSPFALQ